MATTMEMACDERREFADFLASLELEDDEHEKNRPDRCRKTFLPVMLPSWPDLSMVKISRDARRLRHMPPLRKVCRDPSHGCHSFTPLP